MHKPSMVTPLGTESRVYSIAMKRIVFTPTPPLDATDVLMEVPQTASLRPLDESALTLAVSTYSTPAS